MMPSGPRYILFLMVALTFVLGVLLFLAPRASIDKLQHPAQSSERKNPQ
ncbi:hypothetical protein GA0061102_101948 [Rhizobium miluonense]|uniref:Uncharacterized protein n=1 Tax=Rhizobium miluonense TaxID=411945 RepID=A0A1C3VXE4_9HYPH|nr:hypothetical protein GA0061102_101948 [Rhizobium miluonense]